MDCSVLVPVYNEKDHIAASVEAMCNQRFSGTLEFLLVDGGSTDGTMEILRKLALRDRRIRLLENPRRTIPCGLNIALSNARGRWVARMDAHTEYPSDYLQRGVQRLLEGGTRWVSGPQVPVGRSPLGRAVAFALGTPLGQGGSGRWATSNGSAREHELDTGVFCGVWERDTLLAYGGWDERWSRNEDSEMAARFHERGERLICVPGMAAVYRPRESWRALWAQYFQNGEFRAKTARSHPRTLRSCSLLPSGVVVAGACAVATPAPVRTAARAGLSVYGAVLAGAGVRAAAKAESPGATLLVAAALAVMHVAFGAGFLRGVRINGLPIAALAATAGLHRTADRLTPARSRVFAPSLEDPTAGAAGAERLRPAA